MFNKEIFEVLDLTDKEEELLCFILDNSEKLGSEFNVHQVSCLHYIESKACYEKLYEKGLLKKPRRGIYSINVELLNYLEQKAEDDEELYKQEKEANRKFCAWFCRMFFIPMILFGALVCIISPICGSISILIGVFEFFYSHKYFKKDKKKDE